MKISWILCGLLSLQGAVLAQPLAIAPRDTKEATRLNNAAVALAKATPPRDQEAIKLYDEAIRLNPGSETIAVNRARALGRLERYADALAQMDALLERLPNSKKAHLQRYRMLDELNLLAAATAERFKILMMEEEQGDATRPAESVQNLLTSLVSWFEVSPLEMQPRAGEIALYATFETLGKDSLQMQAMAFAVPNGRARLLSDFTAKKVWTQEAEVHYGQVVSLPLEQLRSGDLLIVIGEQGKDKFVAHRILIAPRTPAEEKLRGSLFNKAQIPLIEDQNYPKLDAKATGSATFEFKDSPALSALAAVLVRDGERTALLTTLSALQETGADALSIPAGAEATLTRLLATATAVRGLGGDAEPALLPAKLPARVSQPFGSTSVVAVDVTAPAATLPLATTPPQRGDVVYLAGWYDAEISWREAIVAHNDSTRLFLHIGEAGEAARWPGSVIVNRAGEVVGLQVAGEAPFIAAVSLEALRRAVAQTEIKTKP